MLLTEMKLTKDDLFAHDIGVIVKCDDWEKTGDQILKNQEKAENWDMITDNPNWVKGTREFGEIMDENMILKQRFEDENLQKYLDAIEIVERLKKPEFIETVGNLAYGCTTYGEFDWNECQDFQKKFKKLLQKILEGKE